MLFCIAGMHRSGTSMITRLLHLCGMYLGRQEDLLPPSVFNPDGYWENENFVKFNDLLLMLLGGSWENPPEVPDNWLRIVHVEGIRQKAKRLLAPLRVRFFSGWKDPRNSLTLGFWRAIAPELKVVVAFRHPLEVALSLNRRDGMELIKGMELWYVYNHRLWSQCDNKFFIIEYEEALNRPDEILLSFFNWADISVPYERIRQAIGAVKVDYRHFDHRKYSLNIPKEASHVIDLYAELKNKSQQFISLGDRRLFVPPQHTVPRDKQDGFLEQCDYSSCITDCKPHVTSTRDKPLIQKSRLRNDCSRKNQFLPAEKRSDRPICSIIIPVYNQWNYTDKCLKSIRRCAPGSLPFEVIVVDNGSEDDTGTFLDNALKRYKFLKVVHLDQNCGFAKACNVGAESAVGKTLVFLHNDTVVLEDWLEALVDAHMKETDAGIIGAKLLYPDRKVQHAGINLRWYKAGDSEYLWPVYVWHKAPETAPQVNQQREVLAVSGACLLIDRNIFGEVGGFDESYFLYFEDIDLCLKVQMLRRRVIYCPNSVVIHFGGRSLPSRHLASRMKGENYQYFYEKWALKLKNYNGIVDLQNRTVY